MFTKLDNDFFSRSRPATRPALAHFQNVENNRGMLRVWLLLALVTVLARGEITDEYVSKAVVEFTSANITQNLKEWESDLVIMFYAPWCVNCQHLLPTWGAIASIKADNPDVAVGKFDCEASPESVEICKQWHVDRYPSVYFLGFGNFNQAEGGAIIGKVRNPRLVRFVADLYPEAIYDWVNMLCSISAWQRTWDGIKGFFTGRSRANRQVERLQQRVVTAERKAELFSKELERYKAIELFDTLGDHGDPFGLLHSLDPDEQNLPLRVCVAETASEFCRYFQDESYCRILPNCEAHQLEPEVCRPEKCPFEDQRGCRVVSICMQPAVIKQYQEALAAVIKQYQEALADNTIAAH